MILKGAVREKEGVKKLARPVSAADPPGPLPPPLPVSSPIYLFTRPLLTSCRLGKK